MSVNLDKLLRPGEKIVYRARIGAAFILKFWLGLIIFWLGFVWLLSIWQSDGSLVSWSHWNFLTPIMIVLYFTCILLVRGEALVTDRRLLRREGLFRHRITEMALSEVTRVYGLEPGSPHSIQVENVEGALLRLHLLPYPRKLGQAVAKAAGLPLPTEPAPIEERAANMLTNSGAIGAILGVLLALAALVPYISLDRSDPLGIAAFILVITIVVPGGIGLVVGYFLGSFVAILYFRPMATAEVMRTAIHAELADPGKSPQSDDLRRSGHRMLFRLASLVYGQRITPPHDGGDEPAR